jgi:hypothetical protein
MKYSDIKFFMACNTCNNKRVEVGVTKEGALVIWCPECNKKVASIVQWPDPQLTSDKIKCDLCGKKVCDHNDKEELN